jgi:hypothetical protein
MRRTILDDPQYYVNRHMQWLDFNRRVLGADGNVRRSRTGRDSRGISVQEQLMRAARHSPSAFDTRPRKTRRKIHGAVYTDSAGSAAPDDRTAESASQDSLNASL